MPNICINICVFVFKNQYCTGLFVSHYSERRKTQLHERWHHIYCRQLVGFVMLHSLDKDYQICCFVQYLKKYLCSATHLVTEPVPYVGYCISSVKLTI
jgi:hypothetical protein